LIIHARENTFNLCEEEECNRFKGFAEIVIAPPALS